MPNDNTTPNANAQHIAQPWIDSSECPSWGTAADGRRVNIEGDETLQLLFSDWQKDACAHPSTCVIRFINAGGSVMHQLVCRDCGHGASGWLKRVDAERHGIALDYCRDRAQSLRNQYNTWRKERLDAIANATADRVQPDNRKSYHDYLNSPQWMRKRALILRRANQMCEGCLSRPATQVHHLTYAHLFNEFAFELVALCEPCHDRLHGKS